MSNQPQTIPPQGNVHVGGDWVQGDKVGGNKIVVTGDNNIVGDHNRMSITSGIAGADLAVLFAPILSAINQLAESQRPAAEKLAQELQAEAAKGDAADDSRIGRLLDGLTALVPGAASAVVAVFASPILAGIAGPVTKFVLEKIQGK